jgi:hypothetical protein
MSAALDDSDQLLEAGLSFEWADMGKGAEGASVDRENRALYIPTTKGRILAINAFI